MNRGTLSARVVRVSAVVLVLVGAVLACGGVAMLAWPRVFSDRGGAADLLGVMGWSALAVGASLLTLGALLARWSSHFRSAEIARAAADAAKVADVKGPAQVEPPEWALRTPHTQGVNERPAETTDTWAALDAMRAERHQDTA